jgi:hypothetical protein
MKKRRYINVLLLLLLIYLLNDIFLINLQSHQFILSASASQNEWKNTNYKYCRQIIISACSSNVPSGYSVSITFNNASLVFYSLYMNSNNDRIRDDHHD